MDKFSLEGLDDCRIRIDEIDIRLLEMLNERTRIVEEIGAIKRALKLPIYEPKREDTVLNNVLEHNGGPLPPDAVRRVFERIMDEMRNLQKIKMQEEQKSRERASAG